METVSLINLFPFANKDFQDELKKFSTFVNLPKGTMVGYPGARCDFTPIVIEGYLKVYAMLNNGKEIFLYKIGPGETCMLTNLAIYKNRPYPAYAVCETDVIGFTIPSQVANAWFEKYSYWRNFVLDTVVKNAYEVFFVLNEIMSKPLEQRLREYLVENANNQMVVNCTHEDIAKDIGTAREVVSRLLKELEKQGLLELKRGKIHIRGNL
jgi:cAMP-binding proteins - catabolite gene activator and regulatory subunit of cAMP-dependent protein kinases